MIVSTLNRVVFWILIIHNTIEYTKDTGEGGCPSHLSYGLCPAPTLLVKFVLARLSLTIERYSYLPPPAFGERLTNLKGRLKENQSAFFFTNLRT